MSKLEKCVCAIYICLAIVIGGFSAYFKVIFSDIKNSIVEEDNNLNKNQRKVASTASTISIKAELTAYCNCHICSEIWGSQTSMQTHTRVGVIAAPKDIPLGSKIYIPELKDYKEDSIFSVEDRGGAVIVKNDGTYIIDIWLPTHEQVEEFGRKKAVVYLMT